MRRAKPKPVASLCLDGISGGARSLARNGLNLLHSAVNGGFYFILCETIFG